MSSSLSSSAGEPEDAAVDGGGGGASMVALHASTESDEILRLEMGGKLAV